MVRPALAGQVAQASIIGAALTGLGILTQHLIDRRRSRTRPGRDTPSSVGTPRSDSSIDRTPAVGSDAPTAIRVRTPSTLDYIPTPLAASPPPDEARSSTLGRS